jgi:hypothetical protein
MYIARLTADKDQAIKKEDYDNAENFRKGIAAISDLAMKLRENRALIARAIER